VTAAPYVGERIRGAEVNAVLVIRKALQLQPAGESFYNQIL